MAHLGNYSAQDAVADGVDSLEHIWSVFNYIIPAEEAARPDHRAQLDLHNPLAQTLIATLAERHVYVDPTLVVFRNMILLNDLEEIHDHPDLAYVPRRMRRLLAHPIGRPAICRPRRATCGAGSSEVPGADGSVASGGRAVAGRHRHAGAVRAAGVLAASGTGAARGSPDCRRPPRWPPPRSTMPAR